MSKKMTRAGYKAFITRLKNHQKMVVAGYKARLSRVKKHIR